MVFDCTNYECDISFIETDGERGLVGNIVKIVKCVIPIPLNERRY